MNLETAFDHFLKQHFPAAATQKVLLAVSGGPDSMALLHLFARISKNIAVAHCNFGLRGAESHGDQQHVQEACATLGITCYTRIFDTKLFATEHAMSIQVAARKLRYDWFAQLQSEHHFDFIATAHHRDDNIETVLMNMVRGTGVKGITGIPIHNGSVIRPLLFAAKEELKDYLHNLNYTFRTDVSNAENKYTRNNIRNTILPKLNEINPLAGEHIDELSKHARFAYALIREKTDNLIANYLTVRNGTSMLAYNMISEDPFAVYYLFEIISAYGFNNTQCKLIHESFLAGRPGTRFFSDSFELIIDRQSLVIVPLHKDNTLTEIIIDKLPAQTIKINQHNYVFEFIDINTINEYKNNHLYLAADDLDFPIVCRTWKHGDTFQPLGISGSKKVSDFLIDNKVNLNDKRNICVLETQTDGIIALLNFRIDNRVKISPHTRSVLHIYKTEKETM